MSSLVRTADPYRDLDVIDARAPRFNQAVVGLRIGDRGRERLLADLA